MQWLSRHIRKQLPAISDGIWRLGVDPHPLDLWSYVASKARRPGVERSARLRRQRSGRLPADHVSPSPAHVCVQRPRAAQPHDRASSARKCTPVRQFPAGDDDLLGMSRARALGVAGLSLSSRKSDSDARPVRMPSRLQKKDEKLNSTANPSAVDFSDPEHLLHGRTLRRAEVPPAPPSVPCFAAYGGS